MRHRQAQCSEALCRVNSIATFHRLVGLGQAAFPSSPNFFVVPSLLFPSFPRTFFALLNQSETAVTAVSSNVGYTLQNLAFLPFPSVLFPP